MALIERIIEAGQREDDIDIGVEPAQLAFELNALLQAAELLCLLLDGREANTRAHTATTNRLD